MLLQLDFSSDEPIYLQIRNQIVQGIAQEHLLPEERLPTIRALADEAGINMMTVNKAYALLKQEGYITADRRSGAVVVVSPQTHSLPPKSQATLRTIVSEAKLAGLSEQDFKELCATLCAALYHPKEGN